MSATPDSTLADSDQRIADLERQLAEREAELAECRAERDEALEQQTATAEVLQVINSSPGDLTPVFEAILEKAHTLCGAVLGGLLIYDGEEFRPIAIHAEPSFAEYWRQTALRSDRVVLGAISAYRQEVRPFSDKHIALLQNFAAQAVIAMENARLITETREALEQQTATAEVLQVINASPGDLAPVFEAVLSNAVGLCEAKFGTLYLCEADAFRAVATHNAPPAFVEARMRAPLRPPPDAPLGRVAATKQVAHVPDIRTNRSFRERDPFVVDGAELGGFRTVLSVPMLKDKELIGTININRQEVRPFTDKQIALVESFAAQAVIAMENARLITETRETLEQRTATAEVLGVINASPGDLTPVFDAMLEKAMRLCEAAHGVIRTYDGEFFHQVARRGEAEVLDHLRVRGPIHAGSDNAFRALAKGERVVHIPDLESEAYSTNVVDNRERVSVTGARTWLAVALDKESTLLGAIIVYRREVRPFTDKQIALLQNFAAQAVIAMENARLLGELRERTDEVAELNRGLEERVAEQVEELGRVGRLKRFLAPQLAELIVSQGDEKILESHRREIVVVFCDLRGYTAFTETAEPEEVLKFLRQYHGALGPLVSQFEGTLDQFSGDGIMVFFNDPVPCPDPAERAVKMAMAMREEAGKLIAAWRRHGCELGFGAGIAQGYATLGQIGFSERSGYTAIGTVCNLAARLCAEAKDGQILVSSHIAEAVEAVARLEDLGNLELKGLRRPVAAFNVVQSTSAADARPNLTVVASGPGA